jgi:tol-pal system protein YbgF
VSPEASYNAALATLRLGEHGQAVLDFLDFIAKHPRHPLVANAHYWIGEAYYVQRDYRQALVEFQKVLDVTPGSHKVPDALLKIGLSYRGLRQDKQARTAWQRVVREFPKSDPAVKARALLQ